MAQTKKTCRECGALLPGDAPAGLCPKCLLRVGMGGSATNVVALADDATLANAPQPPAARPTAAPEPSSIKLKYFGDYELLEEIARGGMGVVYKARQTSLNRIVAVKMILAGQLAGQTDVERFHSEAEAAAQLDHPGIVPIYEVGQHQGQHYFSMGYVPGGSLAGRLADGPLPPAEAAELTLKIATAIAYAHKQGVIHRDLKPANVLLDPDGQPRISDFGLAKRVEGDSELTATGQVLGTPSFMPPEQASGKLEAIGETTDVYAMGALLYMLLTGRPPFQSDNPVDTLMQVLDKEPVPPRQLTATIPRDLETICLKCLSKQTRHRYESADELAAELGRYLRGEPILARPSGPAVRLWRWCRRNRTVAALAAAVAASLLVGLIASTYFAVQASHRAREANKHARAAEAQRNRADQKALDAQQAAGEAALQAEQARRNLYLADVNLAKHAWEAGEIRQAKDLLERHRAPLPPAEDLRGFEWNYLHQLLNNHQSSIQLFEPDGREIVAISDAGRWVVSAVGSEVRLHDLESQTKVWVSKRPASGVTALAVSPQGKLVALGGFSGTVQWIDPQQGNVVHKLSGHSGYITALAFSPDGKWLASADAEATWKIWDVASGQELASGAQPKKLLSGKHAVECLAFDGDGKRLATASYQLICLWDAESGDRLQQIKGHATILRDIAFSPDGKTLASAGFDGLVQLWNLDASSRITLRGHANDVHSVAFSPDGNYVATAGLDRVIRLWHASSGRRGHLIRGHETAVRLLRFAADGKTLAAVAADGTARRYETHRPQETFDLPGYHDSVPFVAFQGNERVVAVGFGNGMTIWDASTGQSVYRSNPIVSGLFGPSLLSWSSGIGIEGGHHIQIVCGAFSGDGRRFASADQQGMISVWNASNGKLLGSFQADAEHDDRRVHCLALNADGSRLAVGMRAPRSGSGQVGAAGEKTTATHLMARLADDSRRAKITLWDLDREERILELPGHSKDVYRLAFSSNGHWLASAGGRDELAVWNLASRRQTRLEMSSTVSVLGFFPQADRLATGTVRGDIHIWNLASAKRVAQLDGHVTPVTALAFTHDGRRLASGDATGLVKLFNARTYEEIFALPGRTRAIESLAFSENDAMLVCSSSHGKVRVWQANF